MAPLPEGWLGCPETSVSLVEGIFFAFKTPLENYRDNSFTISSVLKYAEKKNWDLGLWIDLTFTEKYYSRKTMQKYNNIEYIKLGMPGRQSPSESQTVEFINHCTKFLEKNPGKVIGVHCTHGFNRTGYLICSYLSHIKKYTPHDALKAFAAARPPGIYRQLMVDEFVRRYSTGSVAAWKVPQTVPWKEKTVTKRKNNHIAAVTFYGNQGPNSLLMTGNNKLQKDKPRMTAAQKRKRLQVKTMEDELKEAKGNPLLSFQKYLSKCPQVQIISDNDKRQQILQEIKSLAELPESTTSIFGGNQKEEFLTQENFSILKGNHELYSVSWCPEEYYRFILFLNSKQEVYLVSTQNSIHHIPTLKFPLLGPLEGDQVQNLHSTILEGIIVKRRKSTEDKVGWFNFEITNMLAYNGSSTTSMNLKARQDCINTSIIGARGKIVNNLEPFSVQLKHMWNLQNLSKLQTFKWSSHYSCGIGGLIFYPHVTENPILYWKCPQRANLAYFRLFLEYGLENESVAENPRALLHIDEQETPYAELNIPIDRVSEISGLNGRIIECAVHKVVSDDCGGIDKQWKFKREASTRTYSDSLSTVQSIWNEDFEKNVSMHEVFVDFLGPKKRQRSNNNSNNKHVSKVNNKS